MKNTLLNGTFLFFLLTSCNPKQEVATPVSETFAPKVILITVDGLRWQELFTGADSLLVSNKDYVSDTTDLKQKFWRNSPEERRKVLMPFFWSKVQEIGQLNGNRNLGSQMNLTNTMRFSYPGYNEILTGKADDEHITSNDKMNNPNKTILELVNQQPGFEGKVAAFGSWDVFPYIVNEERSGVPVNAGFENALGDTLSEREQFLNELQSQIPSPWSTVRLDAFTHHYTLEYMKKAQPRLVYIAYGETDDFAHDGDYDAYLTSAQTTDAFIKDLWNKAQNDPFYKDQTTFIITTDHGRGTLPLDTWRSHGSSIEGSDQVWLVAFGNGVKPLGEATTNEQLYANQIAPTVLQVLHVEFDTTSFDTNPLKINSK
ncbi:alkaline phosphatase family protein [Arenibacter sp. GZD96]|uniref:alkaline phosphatase family protein n=1 Tax=Aurantibrevibacter litoralis TaxID=3106030 RepID=UPI002AFEA9A2|nr:alkaline phosphatase family protein [Arenibacter sp. GZD-96]MEA1786541.1 alkaline phosphatase family protein [Arenibacter sp. GZD-96]